jgi:hypothetical protein
MTPPMKEIKIDQGGPDTSSDLEMTINQELSRWYRITGGAGLSWMTKLLEVGREVSKGFL